MPGGYIFITRRALANMKNEAELAGVLSHEVAHVDGKQVRKTVVVPDKLVNLVVG